MNTVNEPLSISISAPVKDGKRIIELYKPEDHFHVVIRNNSDQPIELWSPNSSWGFNNLSFEITTSNEEKFILKKVEREWDKNFPGHFSIEPYNYFVIDVNFYDDTWQNFPVQFENGLDNKIKLSAIYQIEQTIKARELHIWLDKIVSEKKEYVIWY